MEYEKRTPITYNCTGRSKKEDDDKIACNRTGCSRKEDDDKDTGNVRDTKNVPRLRTIVQGVVRKRMTIGILETYPNYGKSYTR